jgi:hypothetical protein
MIGSSCLLAPLRNLGSLVIFLCLTVSPLLAKRKDDRVVLKNGDKITGEIKKIERGTLFFKPDYALKDIEIDWTRVGRLESRDDFTVVLTNGSVYTGLIQKTPPSDRDKNEFTISMADTVVECRRSEVVSLQAMEESRWNQLTGSVDYGFSFASDNSQTQSSLGADIEYRGERNWWTGSGSSTFSSQANATDTTRETFAGAYWRRLTSQVFGGFLVNLLSSSQQELALRTTLGGAFGRTLVRTDKTNFVALGGLVVSRERYTSGFLSNPLSTNAEALAGLNYSTFRFKVFDLKSRLSIFPNLSQGGRFRIGSESSVSWEFVRNLYWSLRIYENFDSRPPVNAPRNDFGVTNSIGWKF